VSTVSSCKTKNLKHTLGDFKVGVSVGVYCTKCTLNTGVNTNFEIAHYLIESIFIPSWQDFYIMNTKIKFSMICHWCDMTHVTPCIHKKNIYKEYLIYWYWTKCVTEELVPQGLEGTLLRH
jgi:hypothetical protein